MVRRLGLSLLVVGCGSAEPRHVELAAPTPAPAVAAPRCGALRGALRARIAAQTDDAELARSIEDELFRCAEAGGFTWAFEATQVWVDEQAEASPHADGVGVLVRIAPDGSRAERRFDFQLGFGTSTVLDIKTLDLDGDATPEAWVETLYGDPYAPDIIGREVLTARDGALVRYPGTNGLDIHALKDVDGDGTLDLVGTEFITNEDRCEGGDFELTGPTVVWHGVRGGGFAPDDDVAAASAAKACPGGREPPYYVAHVDEGARAIDLEREMTEYAIACARIWGVSTEEILRSLGEVCRSYGSVCISDTGLEPDDPDRCPKTYLLFAKEQPKTRVRSP